MTSRDVLGMQAAQQVSEAITAILCCPARAAWAPALTAADILYRIHPADLEAALTAFAQDLGSKPTVILSLLQRSARTVCIPLSCSDDHLQIKDFLQFQKETGSMLMPLVQARLGCAALLKHAAGFATKPMQLIAEVLKASLSPCGVSLMGPERMHMGSCSLDYMKGMRSPW